MKKVLGMIIIGTVLLTGCSTVDNSKEWPKIDLTESHSHKKIQENDKEKDEKHSEKKIKRDPRRDQSETKKIKHKPKKAHVKENDPRKEEKTKRYKNKTLSNWNSDKTDQLIDLMKNWGNEMGQQYDLAYPNGEEINYYGYHYPNDVSKDNFGVDGEKVDMVLTSDNIDEDTYQIVAIFSDINTSKYPGAHLYFFTLKDGKPVVLVTSQNQGNDENLLYFKKSENKDLVANYESIVLGNGHHFSPSTPTEKPKHKQSRISNDDKIAITNEFYVWATNQAKKGDMAITTLYFNHGAAGRGDWYADTPDGKMLVQDNGQDLPGSDAFPIDLIGGMLFFYALDGTVGHDDKINSGATADGYTLNLDVSLPASKYILGDNGVVYEFKKAAGDGLSTGSGFAECNDDGSFNTNYPPTPLIVSEDGAAQAKLHELIAKYS